MPRSTRRTISFLPRSTTSASSIARAATTVWPLEPVPAGPAAGPGSRRRCRRPHRGDVGAATADRSQSNASSPRTSRELQSATASSRDRLISRFVPHGRSRGLFWLSVLTRLHLRRLSGADVGAGPRCRPRASHVSATTPTVSVVVVAHNEARRIGARLDNLLALDYPRERLEIILASDGSTDDTVERARAYEHERRDRARLCPPRAASPRCSTRSCRRHRRDRRAGRRAPAVRRRRRCARWYAISPTRAWARSAESWC